MSADEIAISTHQLTRRFGDYTAVSNLDLSVKKGTIYGFLGPNGCGKSTTIRMLCGLLAPTSGYAKVLDFSIPKDAEALRLRMGYMTQKFSMYEDLSIKENLQFFGRIYNIKGSALRQRVDELLHTYTLEALASRRAGTLSGGQRQRLALANATLHKPDLLFLDEPTSAVDPENRRNFWEKLFDLCDQGTTILVSTHYMDEAERCHRLAILESGKLCAEGEPKALMAQLGASIVAITGEDLRPVKSALQSLEEVTSTSQQGMRLRVVVDKSIAAPCDYLQQHLGLPGLSFEEVHPSLEDVFVKVTHHENRQ